MRDLVYTAFTSLDGVVDSPGGGPGEEHRAGGWVFKDIEFNPDAYSLKAEELEETTALMFGRRSYESFAATWPTSEDHVSYKELPKYVVSSTLAEDALVDGWGPTKILRSSEDIAELKETDGGAIFIHGSAELARRLADAGLIDRYHLLVFPVLLGAGKSLFSRSDRDKQLLNLPRLRGIPERRGEDGLRRRGLNQVQGDGAAAALAKLSRGAPDVAAQRASQMRLVEVSESANDIGDWDVVRQESRCRARAFDLPYGALSEPGRGAEPAFDRARRDRWTVASAHLGNERIPNQGPSADEALDQGLGVVGARRLPANAVQPEGAARGIGQFEASVDERRCGHRPQRGADAELDSDEGRAFGDRRGAGPCLGPGKTRVRPALALEEHQPPADCCDGGHLRDVLARTGPYGVDPGRVRCAGVELQLSHVGRVCASAVFVISRGSRRTTPARACARRPHRRAPEPDPRRWSTARHPAGAPPP